MKTGEQLFGAITGLDQLEIMPAYGRTIATALQDWKDGKDFKSRYGYLSIRDIAKIQFEGYNFIRIADHTNTVAILLEI